MNPEDYLALPCLFYFLPLVGGREGGRCVLSLGFQVCMGQLLVHLGPWPLQSKSSLITYEGSKNIARVQSPQSEKLYCLHWGWRELDAYNVTSYQQSAEPACPICPEAAGPWVCSLPKRSSGSSSESQPGCKVLSHTWWERTDLTAKEGMFKKTAGENTGFSSSGM